jgi:hypothetical protein
MPLYFGRMECAADTSSRPGGPVVQMSAQPGRAGVSMKDDASAVGAALRSDAELCRSAIQPGFAILGRGPARPGLGVATAAGMLMGVDNQIGPNARKLSSRAVGKQCKHVPGGVYSREIQLELGTTHFCGQQLSSSERGGSVSSSSWSGESLSSNLQVHRLRSRS